MSITVEELLAHVPVDRTTLDVWIEASWLRPARSNDDLSFTQLDLARARLISELIQDLGVNEDGVDIILNLLDQVHSLRRLAADLADAARPSAG